jgi:fructokinase
LREAWLSTDELYGGIEAGGTKFVCAVGAATGEILGRVQFPTGTPEATLGQAIDFFRRQSVPVASIGIGSFGPVDLNPTSPSFGRITAAPKPGWQDVDIAGQVRAALGVPARLDTDVNAAALGEHRWGAAQGLETFVYLTVGTGIGGGGMAGGQLLHGLVHPEMGHQRIPHDGERDPFAGNCPHHGDCWEGLACGPAIERRWGKRGSELPPDHPAWALEAHYLALGLANLILVLSPQRIIVGGGVMHQLQLFPAIRREVQVLLAGYVRAPAILERMDDYIVPPALGDGAGVLGAIALAQEAHEQLAAR